MNLSKEQITKWAIFGAAILGGGIFVLPILLKIAIDAITLAIIGVALLAIWFTLPGICEAFAQMGWRLYEFAVRADPISKLKRQLNEFDQQIERTEKHISDASASHQELRNTLKKERDHLTEDEISDFIEQISMLDHAGKEMIEMRNQAIRERDQFAREIRAAEAKFRIGNAMKSALSAMSLAKKAGKEGMGAQIALDEVQKRLAQSQARLNTMLTRPKGTSMSMGEGRGRVEVSNNAKPFAQSRSSAIEDRNSRLDRTEDLTIPMQMNAMSMATVDHNHRNEDMNQGRRHQGRCDSDSQHRDNFGHCTNHYDDRSPYSSDSSSSWSGSDSSSSDSSSSSSSSSD